MSKKVLIIEDDKLLRKGLKEVLVQRGMEVEEAANGKEGHQKALKEKPDLIVTDVHMPEMNGLDMIDRIREDKGWGSRVPIIILTVDEATSTINKALSAGVTFYLSKSGMTPDIIADQISVALG